ncbi:hypothetical protein [Algoriphagus antarcticus]|nr:hypothetical protein [Algoriphagus antarcticus]
MAPQVAIVHATPKHSDSEDPTQNEVGTGQVVKGGYGEDIDIGNVWSHTEDGGYLSDKKSKNDQEKKDCCSGNSDSKQKTPNEISRENGKGYGYVGNSKEVDGITYYKMSDRRGNTFWVDKNWNSMKGINMFEYFPGGSKFRATHMGQDLISIKNSKARQVIEILINRGLEIYFMKQNMPWLLNDPVIPVNFTELNEKKLLKN